MRFDEFLAGLPAGIQLFSLLQSNPALLKLMATIMGAAPRLAAIITRRPHVFDGLLDPALLTELPDRAYLSARLAAFLEGDRAYEDVLDRLAHLCLRAEIPDRRAAACRLDRSGARRPGLFRPGRSHDRGGACRR